MVTRLVGMSVVVAVIGMVLGGCGKVSQEAGLEDEKEPTFKLSAFLPLQLLNSEEKPSKATRTFSQKDTRIYVAVQEWEPTGLKNISWGRGALVEDKVTTLKTSVSAQNNQNVTPSVAEKPEKKFKSYSYDLNDFEVTKSDFGKARLKFNSAKFRWEIDAADIPAKAETVLLAVYNDAGHYALRLVDQETITGNTRVPIGEITAYETFIAALILTQPSASTAQFERRPTRLSAISLFSPLFFDAIRYDDPRNKVESFNIKSPKFEFDGAFEKSLLNVLSLFETDKTEALTYVTEKKDELGLPDAAHQHMITSIEDAIAQEAADATTGE